MTQKIAQRQDGRRKIDVQRQMLEELVNGQPRYFVAVVGMEDTYSSHFENSGDAREFVRTLLEVGVHPENIACYVRTKLSSLVDPR